MSASSSLWNTMPLAAGIRLGAYEIVSLLGSGGMGEVYRARDHQLSRDVAIKVLPSELLDTAERAARFEREARVLGSLNHPNIAHVYGFDRAGDVRYLVMELVEGVTLEARLRNGPLAADEALDAAKQIVEALDAAHAGGIVHRDLKPANIKARTDGVIKVLDFGLAKVFDDVGDADGMSKSPTITTGATRDGVILGTAAYMSPEQARGQRVDKRTDIWAFGCVVYEMLTGWQVFGGATISDTIANVLGRPIDWSVIPGSTAPSVQRLLRRCLERDVKRRLHDIADARLDLDDADASGDAALTAQAGKRRPARFMTAVLVIGALLAAGLVARQRLAPTSASSTLLPQVVRFTVAVDENAVLEPPIPAVAISADGQAIVFNARTNAADATSNHLFLRRLAEHHSTLIAGTAGGRRAAFSPDGLSIVFVRMPTLEITKVALDGSAPQVVCRLANANVSGLSWGEDGTIMFAYQGSGGAALMRVNASGGEPTTMAAPDPAKGELGLSWPQRLPDGDHVLYSISRRSGVDAVAVLALKTGERREIVADGKFARYLPTGHLVYLRGGNLVAQRFDVRAVSVVGAAIVVIRELVHDPGSGGAHFAVADQTGAMVYAPSASSGIRLSMVWIDRTGATVRPPLESREYRQPNLSFDGKRVALGAALANRDLWIYEIDREVMSRLTTTPEEEETPQWSPDGTRVAFASERDGQRGLFVMQSDGSGSEQRLWATPDHFHVNAWSPDGKSIILNTRTATSQDLSVYSFDSRTVTPFVATPANEFGAAISRDGRWVAYVSDKSGREETYVGPFGRPAGAVQISRDGGSEPAWAHSGREVFFRDASAYQLMTVAIGPGEALDVGPPRMLVKVPFASVDRDNGYIVSQDDKRFLGIRPDDVQGAREILVTLNWFEELKRLLPH